MARPNTYFPLPVNFRSVGSTVCKASNWCVWQARIQVTFHLLFDAAYYEEEAEKGYSQVDLWRVICVSPTHGFDDSVLFSISLLHVWLIVDWPIILHEVAEFRKRKTCTTLFQVSEAFAILLFNKVKLPEIWVIGPAISFNLEYYSILYCNSRINFRKLAGRQVIIVALLNVKEL